MTTATTHNDIYQQLTDVGLASRPNQAAAIAQDLAARLDKATAELAQKDAAIMTARTDALSEVEGLLKVTHLIFNETGRAILIERVRALRLAGVLK
jgi:hypothetical protein